MAADVQRFQAELENSSPPLSDEGKQAGLRVFLQILALSPCSKGLSAVVIVQLFVGSSSACPRQGGYLEFQGREAEASQAREGQGVSRR